MIATFSKKSGIYRAGLLGVAAAIWLIGCSSNVEPPRQAQQPSPQASAATVPTAVSVNALMVGMVDHAGHVIWDAAAEGKAPKTDKDWEEIEHHAIQLAASGTLIALGGTGPADPGWAQLPDWKKYSKELSDEGLAVLAAARSKNRDGISKAGDQIVATCEGCHKQFKPDLPTEGLVHSHYR
jgi:hypothetical protein